MIINKRGESFKYDGVTYRVGGSVIGNKQSEYKGLFGTITEIRDGQDKETDNDTPDIYCTFEAQVLPCDVKELEKTFSSLYAAPKTIDDLILDMVIMAPERIELLDDLTEPRHHPMIYVLLEDWAVDGEHGNSSEVYSDFADAKRVLTQKLQEELETGCIQEWSSHENFEVFSMPDSYECYIDGEYCENHYSISIVAQQICVSERFTRELAEVYKSSCQLEDFISQVSDWDEIGQLTDEQYDRMIRDLRFPERLQSALGKNDHYWESYWQTVSEVAHEFVNAYLKENTHADCYTPKQDNPYPLCVGNGSEACDKCCLYVEMEAESWEH